MTADDHAVSDQPDLAQKERYHRGELKIALDRNHPAHILPPELPPGKKVLDIGCGAGQTLLAAYPDRVSIGLDVDFDALQLGKRLTNKVAFVCGTAEAIPLADQQFDLVVARVSLVYTDIGASLKEIHRVLKQGGEIWMTLHDFAIVRKQVKVSSIKSWIFFGYVMTNSMLFHLTQKQFPFLGKYESFQTERGISRALRQNGFVDISIQHGHHFLVRAKLGI